MNDELKADVAARLKELVALFLPELKKTEWGPSLAVADAADQDRLCEWYAKAWLGFLSKSDGMASREEMSDARPRREFLQSDAGLTLSVIFIWLMFLYGPVVESGPETLPPLDDDMWPTSEKEGGLDQFFSNPALPAWEDVSRICAGVKARLPEGEALPTSAVWLLQSLK